MTGSSFEAQRALFFAGGGAAGRAEIPARGLYRCEQGEDDAQSGWFEPIRRQRSPSSSNEFPSRNVRFSSPEEAPRACRDSSARTLSL